ncbi:MAG: TRAP transporter substrate-binding protein [Rhodospirillales bacterium]|nr:TRAP transporter substrate-binding protein [Rhodospirillales bacterium]
MTRLMGRTFAGLVAGALVLGMGSGASAADFKIRAASHFNENTAIGFGMKAFKRLAEEKSGGRVEVELFLNAELGNEREAAEMVRNGAIEMTSTGLSGVGLYVSGLDVLELPYLYKDADALVRITDALLPHMQKMLNDKGFQSVGFIYAGPRHTNSVKPLRAFADFKNLKLRVPESPLYVGMARAMGASPTPVAFTEVYTSLQTGIVEAMEGDADTIYKQRFYEVAKYVTLTGHIYYAQYVVFNRKYFDGLPNDIQDILMEVGAETGKLQAQENKRQVQLSLDALKKEGVELIELPDAELQKFRDAMAEFNDQHAKSRGEGPFKIFQEAMKLTGR